MSEAPVPRRSSALPPARRTSVHAELTTSSQTTFIRDESSLREPRDATIVTCLASPPKRHRTIRHALRWHETAQGTTRPPNAVRLTRAFARRSAFSRVAKTRARRTLGRPRVARGSPFPRDRPDTSRRSAVNSAARRIPSRRRREERVGSSRGAHGVLRERPLACARRAQPRCRARASPRRARRPRRTTAGAPLASAASKPSAGACDVPAPAFPASVRGYYYFFFFHFVWTHPDYNDKQTSRRIRATPLSSTTRSGSRSPRTRQRSRRRTARRPSRTTPTRAATPRSSRRSPPRTKCCPTPRSASSTTRTARKR